MTGRGPNVVAVTSRRVPTPDLERLIRNARRALPASHRALLEQVGVQEVVIREWPRGVQALYRTIRETAPDDAQLAGALAVWLPDLRVVAFAADLLESALADDHLTFATRQSVIDNLAWHEYGHALSSALVTAEAKADGPRLAGLLPAGLRRAIAFPGDYLPREVFDEVIANVYALMVSRAVHSDDYAVPTFLHPDVFAAFAALVPWPPERP